MKTIGMSLLMLTLLGCRTTPSDGDLLQLHAQRLTQFAGLQVAAPQTIPFENDGDRRVYLEQHGEGFKSGMTGISISPLFANDIPHRNAHIQGWYRGQTEGLKQSPWGVHGLTETNGTPNQASEAIGASAPQPQR